MRGWFWLVMAAIVAVGGAPAWGQRRAVLPQIDEPHPYYYRELYLPQLTGGPSWLTWGSDSGELIYSMAGSLWRQKLDAKEAVQLTDMRSRRDHYQSSLSTNPCPSRSNAL